MRAVVVVRGDRQDPDVTAAEYTENKECSINPTTTVLQIIIQFFS